VHALNSGKIRYTLIRVHVLFGPTYFFNLFTIILILAAKHRRRVTAIVWQFLSVPLSVRRNLPVLTGIYGSLGRASPAQAGNRCLSVFILHLPQLHD
jgi:hypothetical protein